jgi:hypothetical protein
MHIFNLVQIIRLINEARLFTWLVLLIKLTNTVHVLFSKLVCPC